MTGDAPATRQMPVVGAGLLLATTLGGLLLTVALSHPAGIAFFAGYAGIGAYLAIRRPANSVGWLLLLTGWGLASGMVRVPVPPEELFAGRLDPFEAALVWANACGWAIGLFGFLGITLVFPEGHLSSGRDRWMARLALIAWVGLIAVLSFQPTITVTPSVVGAAIEVPNPIALAPGAAIWGLLPSPALLYTAMFPILVVGLLSLFGRFRRSAGLERLRYRWLVAAIVFAAAMTLVWAVTTLGFAIQSDLVWIGVAVAYLCVPVAIAVAVLRYRLYEIDRIISRSIAYAIVSVIVIGVFGAGVVLLSALLSSVAGGQSIAVAGATLVAYGLLQPVIRRVRRAVDRRFDRAGYDVERLVGDFSARLRDEIDVDAVTSDLAATTRSAVAPASVSLWLRPGDSPR
jgi:hypothetical protein